MNKEQFIDSLNQLEIKYNDKMLSQLEQYYELLVEENKKYNLTSIIEKETVYLKHFFDSLMISKMENFNNQYILDMGTGAGFPGIVLKIFFPNIKIDLLDATSKKCEFLKLVCSTLSLENVNIINYRVEDYGKQVKEKYDIVTARAMAPLKHLLEFATPLLKINGKLIALKSNLTEEKQNIQNYYKKLNLSDEKIIEFYLPYENSYRTIYSIRKTKTTPLIYPRQYNQIKKHEI